ncbi:zinc finger protein 307 [Culex quinquefasciatus]|uniref:Zinc finger protein 307 n=1 Tax=Culex quinquefasciatus TaxID=7176 RepID=B0X7D8_CULQU|nr:zinc finger protein 307 [Culex quinquefasciatus]|eukprot:XP_001865560.1 zinc finger protein 307 [Culex quinquefasciatus]
MEGTGKKSRKKVDPKVLEACMSAVRSGEKSFYAASKSYGIPTSTIRYRMSDEWKNRAQKGSGTVLTPAEEKRIIAWLQDSEAKGLPVGKQTLLFKIRDLLVENPRPTPFKDNVPGRKWLTGFLRRHQGKVTLRTAEAVIAAGPSNSHNPADELETKEIKQERLEEVFAEPINIRKCQKSEPPSTFCSLCLRQCLEEQIQEFSTYQSWNGASFVDRRGKLEQMLGGVQIDGDICRTCWRMVELAVDFRQSCLKMVELKERYPVGVASKDEDEEEWFVGGTLEGLGRTRKMVQDHMQRVEFAEVSLRNEINMKVEKGSDDDTTLLEEDTDFCEDHFEEDTGSNPDESENVKEPSDEPVLTLAESIPIPLFTCTSCNRSFESKVSLHVHLNYCDSSKTEPIRTFSCTVCSADFMCRESLTGHLNKHKGIKPFQCSKPSCTKTFYSPMTLRVHERGCGSSPFVCALCGVTTKTLSSYRAHQETHNERTLACPDCDKKFSSRTYLKKHQKVHTNARNYPCTECGKTFKTNYAARVHMRIHTQEKPFSCAICGMGFAYKCLVKPHMEKNHEGAI